MPRSAGVACLSVRAAHFREHPLIALERCSQQSRELTFALHESREASDRRGGRPAPQNRGGPWADRNIPSFALPSRAAVWPSRGTPLPTSLYASCSFRAFSSVRSSVVLWNSSSTAIAAASSPILAGDGGPVIGVTVQDADAGDTTTSIETLIEAAEQVEAVRPDGDGIKEVVGGHSRGGRTRHFISQLLALVAQDRRVLFRGTPVRQEEHYFLLRIAPGEVALGHEVREAYCQEGIIATRWWSLEDIETTPEQVFPEDLAQRATPIREIRAGQTYPRHAKRSRA